MPNEDVALKAVRGVIRHPVGDQMDVEGDDGAKVTLKVTANATSCRALCHLALGVGRTNPMPLLLVLLLTLDFSAFATDLGFAADRPLATTFLKQNLEMVSFGGLGGFRVPKCIAPLKYIENDVYGDLLVIYLRGTKPLINSLARPDITRAKP